LRSYIFIGGAKRGYELIKNLIENYNPPSFAFVQKEDNHEEADFSSLIENLTGTEGNCKITKKLSEEDYKLISSSNYDFCVVCGWRTIIKLDKISTYFKYGVLAAHDSLLPLYRGFAPTNWAIINGEKYCGVSIFKINDGEVDSGEIYSQKSVLIEDDDDINSVMVKVTQATVDGYHDIFDNIECIEPVHQNDELATYTCKRCPDDGEINWDKSSVEVYNLIRALIPPYPASYTYFSGDKLFVNSAKIGVFNDRVFVGRIPGKVISINENGIEVMCGKGTVLISEVIYKGEKMLPNKIVKSITHTFK